MIKWGSFIFLNTLFLFSFGQKYLSPSFNTTVINDIIYKQTIDYQGNPIDLKLDLYSPINDPEPAKPLFIYVHGGGFIDQNQSKNLVHIEALADSLASRGYKVATLNYRLDSSISNRAVINAMHDAKAAIRFLKAGYATYSIDTNYIFIGGESAGAITALTASYINQSNEVLYPTTLPMSNDLSVEGGGNNLQFSSKVKATLCFCAGTKTVNNELLFDTTAINQQFDPPLLMVHGSSDQLIPFQYAVHIAQRANHINLPNLFYPLIGATHCPWFYPLTDSWQYLDTLIQYTVPFLYACTQSKLLSDNSLKFKEIKVIPNPINDFLKIDIPSELLPVKVVIYSISGSLLLQELQQENEQFIINFPFEPGIYFVEILLKDGNKHQLKIFKE